ncbi:MULTISPECIES: hypothetical protein [Pseudomonas]|uniref:hypothetical protein n=1 Tax=Pseudomonas nitroreducens TaxID=46680 RepID=UPI001E46EB5D|nr:MULTISPECIES: hypothetical protein [Pseudomonas]MCE4069296.1 hypothetical protein [Pseudomonas nitritireducens]MCE4079540.1 hypothetical protein [Pseudomonas nitroreducens]
MNSKSLVFSALLLTLAGCGPQGGSGSALAAHPVSVPALPVIQEAVRSLYPTFNGRSAPVLAHQLCSLANGGVTAEQNSAQLKKLGIDPTSLPHQGNDAMALLVNGDTAAQAAACAAYHAVSALAPVNPEEFMRPGAATSPASLSAGGAGKAASEEASTGAAKAESDARLDNVALSRLMDLRLAQSRANADIFALIAGRLAATPGLIESDYRSRAAKMFAELAPRYLDDLKQQIPPASTRYRLNRLTAEQFSFSSDTGLSYQVSKRDGVMLTRFGQPWLGRGVILGKNYYLSMTLP